MPRLISDDSNNTSQELEKALKGPIFVGLNEYNQPTFKKDNDTIYVVQNEYGWKEMLNEHDPYEYIFDKLVSEKPEKTDAYNTILALNGNDYRKTVIQIETHIMKEVLNESK